MKKSKKVNKDCTLNNKVTRNMDLACCTNTKPYSILDKMSYVTRQYLINDSFDIQMKHNKQGMRIETNSDLVFDNLDGVKAIIRDYKENYKGVQSYVDENMIPYDRIFTFKFEGKEQLDKMVSKYGISAKDSNFLPFSFIYESMNEASLNRISDSCKSLTFEYNCVFCVMLSSGYTVAFEIQKYGVDIELGDISTVQFRTDADLVIDKFSFDNFFSLLGRKYVTLS